MATWMSMAEVRTYQPHFLQFLNIVINTPNSAVGFGYRVSASELVEEETEEQKRQKKQKFFLCFCFS